MGNQGSKVTKVKTQIATAFGNPVALSSNNIESNEKETQKYILYGYVQTFADDNKLMIPDDILKLCLLFYQTNFEWTMDLEDNEENAIFNSTFEIESRASGIIATVAAKFITQPKLNFCILTIKALDFKKTESGDTLSKGEDKKSLYCHVNCRELDYEWKHTTNTNWHQTPAVCSISKKPSGVITFDCYFKMLTKPVDMHSNAKYLWELDNSIINDIQNDKYRRFYSPNFNDGGLSLSICNEKRSDKGINRYLTVSLHVFNALGQDNQHHSKTIGGDIDIFDKDGNKYSHKFKDESIGINSNYQLIELTMEKTNYVKCVQITFTVS